MPTCYYVAVTEYSGYTIYDKSWKHMGYLACF